MCLELKDIVLPLWNRLADEHKLPPSLEKTRLALFGDSFHFSVRAFQEGSTLGVAGWEVSRLPGLVVISRAWVHDSYKGKGIGTALAAFRVACFREMQSGDASWGACPDITMVCRTRPDNEVEHHILRKVGWTRVSAVLWELG